MTADSLKALLSSPSALFVLMLLASMTNGVKQLLVIRQTGTPMTFLGYLAYLPETFAVLLANVIGFAVLILTDQLNFASALGVGYGTNSLIDLLPGKRSVALKATPDDPAKVIPAPPGSAAPPSLKLLVLLPFVSLLLGACATLTTQQQIKTVNRDVTSILQSTDAALNAHLITKAEAQAVSAIAHQVDPLLDAAQAASAANDPTQANKTLNLVNTLLAGLTAYVPPVAPAK